MGGPTGLVRRSRTTIPDICHRLAHRTPILGSPLPSGEGHTPPPSSPGSPHGGPAGQPTAFCRALGLPVSVPSHEAPPPGMSPVRRLLRCFRAPLRCHLLQGTSPDPTVLACLKLTLSRWPFSPSLVWLLGKGLQGRQPRIHPCLQGPAQGLPPRRLWGVLKG